MREIEKSRGPPEIVGHRPRLCGRVVGSPRLEVPAKTCGRVGVRSCYGELVWGVGVGSHDQELSRLTEAGLKAGRSRSEQVGAGRIRIAEENRSTGGAGIVGTCVGELVWGVGVESYLGGDVRARVMIRS